ncbi:MAG TPA: glycosyltransferase family 4 protein [Mucilaginibacter sp.]|nr:glycosyltransferase family 4 protein [Mucilaginibacter sp.]
MRKRLAIVTSHPIQYYAPIFRLLQQRGEVDIMVFYTWGEQSAKKYDPGFGATVSWDIPLLDGYPYTWVENVSADPGTHHYKGIANPKLTQQISDWKPDAIMVIGWAWQSHLKVMRYFKGKVPVYFRGDSTLLAEPGGIKRLVKSIFLKWVYKHADIAFYVGTNNKAYFKKYGLKEDQLIFAPHAIDNDRFGQDFSTQANELRSSLNVKPEEIVVLFAGKFEPVKNVELLVSAFIKLNRPDTHLLLVGNGPLENRLKELALGSRNIHFRGFTNQSEIPGVYQACDLFCLPSVSESWGLAVNEAMACGRAVLVSDTVGCAADLVNEGYNGLVFKSGDAQALISSLTELTQSKDELIKFGKKSRSMIQEWSFEKIAEAIENTLCKKITSEDMPVKK